MTDEEKERILQEQRSKEVSSIKPKNKAKIWKKIDELWERMDDWADSTEDDDGPINLWPFRQLYYLADSLEKFTHNLVARKKFMPLFAELLGQFLAMTFYMLILAVISLSLIHI